MHQETTPAKVASNDQLGHMWPERKGVTMSPDSIAYVTPESADGRNWYYEGQHGAEEPADTAARLELAAERDALRHMATWAYSKLHSRTFNSMDDALELDRLKLWCEHGVVA